MNLLSILVALLMISTASTVAAQRPASSPPSGNRIIAQDGDVVVVEDDARVRIVRRREAFVRVVFNAAERWLVILADHSTSAGPADGRVDKTYYYTDVGGAWPFEARWEGVAALEEYSMAPPDRSSVGLGISTPQGLVQLLGREQEFRDQNAVAGLSYTGGGGGGVNRLGFEETERWLVAQVRRNDGVIDQPPGSGVSTSLTLRGGLVGGVTGGISGGVSDSGIQVDPSGAVRVGGRVRPPMKIADVRPRFPEEAARLDIRGIVILEVTIDVDGTVKDARVLRSIPIFDAAALEAVRQWRYEPTTVDGQPVRVVMTVTVAFEPGR